MWVRRALALLEIRGGGAMSSGGQPTIEKLHQYDGVFRVQDETNVTLTVKWQREPSKPTKNDAGTSGWAVCGEKLMRLHVCAQVPCQARYPASKYGMAPVPLHVRLMETAPVAAASPATAPQAPAVAGPAAESKPTAETAASKSCQFCL